MIRKRISLSLEPEREGRHAELVNADGVGVDGLRAVDRNAGLSGCCPVSRSSPDRGGLYGRIAGLSLCFLYAGLGIGPHQPALLFEPLSYPPSAIGQ